MQSRAVRGSLVAVLAASSIAGAAEIRSRTHPNVKVSFKETTICETTPGVKGYSGFVTLPESERQPYETNIFFWFFEARHSPQTAPLSVWLQGGPGAASTDQAVSGHNGPCIVNPDSKTTRVNPHSWTEVANMLYIDQPSQTGFSYDAVVDGLYDLEHGTVEVTAAGPSSPLFIKDKFSSQDPSHTANSTQTAAEVVYHFLQAWFSEFKQYKRDSVSVWSQSYGGHYVPAIASIINKEHKAPGSVIAARSCEKGEAEQQHRFSVDSAGIINGFFDLYMQLPFYNEFAFRNTYDISIYDEATYKRYNETLYAPGACLDSARTCKDMLLELDPLGLVPPSLFANQTLALACGAAAELCGRDLVFGFTQAHGRYYFDVAQTLPLRFPRSYAYGWLNQAEVREALGARTAYLAGAAAVTAVFDQAADLMRSGFVDALAGLVDDGVKVAMIYGDRDYRCNWFGGEAVSLGTNHSRSKEFAAAGYADINIGGSCAGKVRQHGLFSFSRIYNAGHEVPSYKPAESLEIFRRTITGRDVATGQVDLRSSAPDYSTTGPSQVLDVKVPLEQTWEGVAECYTWAGPLSLYCTQEQIWALGNGTAVVRDFVIVEPPSVA